MNTQPYFRNFYEIALFAQREKHRLPAEHHQFIDNMVWLLERPPELTEKQQRYLIGLFYELGGKVA